MTSIINTELHQRSGVVVQPFGTSGAIRLVPTDGDQTGRPFILDASAARELAECINELRP